MKVANHILLLGMSLFGCDNKEDFQQLAQIEIYSGDGDLVKTITDEDTLYKFSTLELTDTVLQDEIQNMENNLTVLYTIILYKTPAAKNLSRLKT